MKEKLYNQIKEENWKAYRQRILQFVLKRIHDPALADDIVQDVLVKGYSQQENLRKSERVLPWLYMITRNTIVDHFRRKKPDVELTDNIQPVERALNNTHFKQEMVECIVPLIDMLPEPYKQALELSEIKGLNQMEVSRVIGLSLSGTKSRVQRGRKKLRDVLVACCRVELDHRGYPMGFDSSESSCDSCGGSM